ncbi:unnamed protein product [Phyllotreta striolata]|uniref:VPS9 domain-containing protein n=1 Tax=Phyllotreta striolata TaxID=444603 RepID=A0A9P0GW78_PHYSR|nr:unnamed protein product [Phyllotreta striolata]
MYSQAKTHLESVTENANIVEDIENFVRTWNFESEYDLSLINEDVTNIINQIFIQFLLNKNDDEIQESIHCVIHNFVWEPLRPILRAKYGKEDGEIFEKSKIFWRNKKLPKELDGKSYCCVPYTAAVVELSMLDTYNSPLEKLNCLCVTYDIIFAELKTALINVISKYSENELEIPIINNEDVTPILTLVVLKSKLQYPLSSLEYIKIFGKYWLKDHKRYILQTFETVITNLLKNDYDFLQDDIELTDIDYCEAITKITLQENANHTQQSTRKPDLREEVLNRVLKLIFTSTTSNMD